jgi:hypothetical protein
VDQSQRIAAKTALDVLAADGFLLAGGQALTEHGISSRPSEDIDLFALHRRYTPATFAASVRKMTTALESGGYTVEITRQLMNSPASPWAAMTTPLLSTLAWTGGRTPRQLSTSDRLLCAGQCAVPRMRSTYGPQVG